MSTPFCRAPALIGCSARPGWNLELRYADGVRGSVCLQNLLEIGVFWLLQDPHVFAAARLDPRGAAIVWDAGIRLDASVLYADLRGRGIAPDLGTEQAFQRFMLRVLASGG